MKTKIIIIEDNIPIPQKHKDKNTKYGLDDLKPGQSILYDYADRAIVCVTASHIMRKNNNLKRFTGRTIYIDGIKHYRIWRTQ